MAEVAAISGSPPGRADFRLALDAAVAARHLVDQWFQSFFAYDRDGVLVTIGEYYAATAERAAYLAELAVNSIYDASLCTPAQDMLLSLTKSISLTGAEQKAFPSIRAEFEEVQHATQSEGWTDDTPFPASFFALRSRFNTEKLLEGRSIIEIASAIQIRALELAGKPEEILQLQPREFEELIAEVLKGFGFSVELTAWTRDGGRDIIAVNHDLFAQKFLVECKRYSRYKPVGISVVQRLHGVTRAERATKGIIVTTSRFTRPAQVFMEQERWLLEGRDFEGLREWLEAYQRFFLKKLVLG